MEIIGGEEVVAVWKDAQGEVRLEAATTGDLVALKLVLGEATLKAIAAQTGRPMGLLNAALHQAARRGLVLMPQSGVYRDPPGLPSGLRSPSGSALLRFSPSNGT